jgi:hypothetical protein
MISTNLMRLLQLFAFLEGCKRVYFEKCRVFGRFSNQIFSEKYKFLSHQSMKAYHGFFF